MLKQHDNIISIARKTIDLEAKAIAKLSSLIDHEFAEAVLSIYNATGRVVVTGIGKSANIATKIVATLNSTGTPAIFMHAADAIHGDLGTITEEDVVVCISKSGDTPEIKVLVPFIQSRGNKIIAITSNRDSFLGQRADYVMHAQIDREADPNNLAPTTSTTAQLVMGDAMAMALLELRGFSSQDFARFHPGGALGKRLYLRVGDLSKNNLQPQVKATTPVKKVIIEISEKMLGVTAVVENKKIIGVITDGDLRRMLIKEDNINQLTAKDIMSANPKRVQQDEMAVSALEIMEKNDITQLLVVDEQNNYAGIVHIHDLTKEGII
ncbi:MAG TPA: KpsF/GutQ family sugar-phosphate isomerase [Flavobacteriaceae bacterium]|nr:KpsF/GutQ family sugar-phosphate isomerase [Flavobacteriaceae bacterium]